MDAKDSSKYSTKNQENAMKELATPVKKDLCSFCMDFKKLTAGVIASLFATLLLCNSSYSLSPIPSSDIIRDHNLSITNVEFLPHQPEQLTIEQAQRAYNLGQFKKLADHHDRFYNNRESYWLRFSLENNAGPLLRAWLETLDSNANNLILYQATSGGYISKQAHSAYALAKPLLTDQLKVIPVELQANNIGPYYLHISNSGKSPTLPILITDQTHLAKVLKITMYQGLILGSLLVIFAFMLINYRSKKDTLSLYFLLTLVSCAVHILVNMGIPPAVNTSNSFGASIIPNFSTAVYLLTTSLFVRKFLTLSKSNPILDKLLLVAVVSSLLASSISDFSPAISAHIVLIATISVSAFTATAAFLQRKSGHRHALYILIGSIGVLLPSSALLVSPGEPLSILSWNNIFNFSLALQVIVYAGGLRLGFYEKTEAAANTSKLIGALHDIADYNDSDSAGNEHEIRGREIADSTFESILIFQDERIIDANSACEQLFGYASKQLIGTTGSILFSANQLSSLPLNSSSQHEYVGEFTLKHLDGSDVHVEVRTKSRKFQERSIQTLAIRDVSRYKKQEEQLRKLGYTDNLTGLYNRALFQDHLQLAIDKAQRIPQKHALLYIDLDQFKHVNDSLGHDVGDELLKEVGRRLTKRVRNIDTVARLGGDEFALLIEDIIAPYNAAKVADSVIEAMSDEILIDDYRLQVSPSIGIAIFPTDGTNGGELLRKADTAMYHAKDQGRNNYQFYSEELHHNIVRRMNLDSELRVAIEREELFLNYQPQVSLKTGSIIGAEALLRWNSSKYGVVSPGEFIRIAEENGLIWPIGEFVLKQACKQAAPWIKEHASFDHIAVNISGIQFSNSDLVDTVKRVLEESNLPAQHLELEITEGAIIDNADDAIKIMKQLKDIGVKLSLDDFGTGYSSLSYLRKFPVDCLKIDRSFVAEIVTDKAGLIIAENIVNLAHGLDLNVVAEGVETTEQLKIMRNMGCDELQGYIFSRPLDADDLSTALAKGDNLYTLVEDLR